MSQREVARCPVPNQDPESHTESPSHPLFYFGTTLISFSFPFALAPVASATPPPPFFLRHSRECMLSKLWNLTIDSEMGIKRRQMGRDVGHPSRTQDSLFADFNLWESQLLPQWAPQIIGRQGSAAQQAGLAWEQPESRTGDSAVVNKMQSLYYSLPLPAYQPQFYRPDLEIDLRARVTKILKDKEMCKGTCLYGL